MNKKKIDLKWNLRLFIKLRLLKFLTVYVTSHLSTQKRIFVIMMRKSPLSEGHFIMNACATSSMRSSLLFK